MSPNSQTDYSHNAHAPSGRTAPFARFELMIAWRYLRARRSEGGISVMTLISLIGIALAVFALIATLAVRAGFRFEFVDTIVGANAHVEVTSVGQVLPNGQLTRTLADYEAIAAKLAGVPGVTRATPVIKGQVMAAGSGRNAGVEVIGITASDLATIPRLAEPEVSLGDRDRFDEGLAIG